MSTLLNKKQAAILLSVSVSTLNNWLKRGLLPSIKMGGSVRFTSTDLDSFIESNRIRKERSYETTIEGK